MRTKLKKFDNVRMRFKGTFERYGQKTNFKGYPEKTILLINVKDDANKQVTSHIWFNFTKGFQALGELEQGDFIEFHARVKAYVKGYRGYREDVMMENPPSTDYKLSHPTKIGRLEVK